MVRKQDNIFDAMEFQQRYHENTFTLDDAYLTPLSQRVQYFSVQYMDKISRVKVILKVWYLLQVYMAWSDHHPHLSDL